MNRQNKYNKECARVANNLANKISSLCKRNDARGMIYVLRGRAYAMHVEMTPLEFEEALVMIMLQQPAYLNSCAKALGKISEVYNNEKSEDQEE